MANEYLKRQPTSSGNSRRWTISFWMKNSDPTQGYTAIMGAGKVSPSNVYNEIFYNGSQTGLNLDNSSASDNYNITANPLLRDPSAWMHVVLSFTDQGDNANTRIKFYINGAFVDHNTGTALDVSETSFFNHVDYIHYIGSRAQQSAGTTTFDGQYFDVFLVDGQTLTADVFGFYKEGKGYQSSGSSDSTDFGPGQWSPHSPRKIKSEIERKGGFGVNGFYLPMNDSSNPGADFHCAPNSIIKLKGEDLPQPRNGAPTTSDAYVSQLRSDPFAANIVLAIPFITGGQDSGAGDYSADIKGSGTNKTVTVNGTFSVGDCPSYYGSALKGSSGNRHVAVSAHSDFANLYDVDHTIEFWYKNDSWNGGYLPHNDIISNRHSTNNVAWRISFTDKNNSEDGIQVFGSNGFSSGTSTLNNDWNHCAVEQYNGRTTIYINGVAGGTNGNKHGYQTYKASTGPIIIGSDGRSANLGDTYSFNGQIQDVRIYKGVAKYKGGFDVSKPYTPVGIEAFRTTDDTCKNNFATLNAVDNDGGVLSNGNLTQNDAGSDGWNNSRATIGASSGKWYWEMRVDVISQVMCASVAGPSGNDATNGARLGYLPGQADDAGVTYYDDGKLYHADSQPNGQVGWGAAYGATDVIGIALDMNDSGGKVWFSKNGSWQGSGNPSTGANAARNDLKTYSDTYFPISGTYFATEAQTFNFGQNPSFSGQVTAGTNADDSGKGLFKYAPPSGFLALCEDNLPTPAIADPGEHFKTVLYTGSSVSGSEKSRGISGLGFKPDLVWLKSRSIIQNHQLYDSVRGFSGGKGLSTDEARVEGDIGGYSDQTYGFVSAANNNGFSVASTHATGSWVNNTGVNYCAWCWKAGGAAVSNADGTITSQVSVNQDAGFSIVSYTANQTSGATVGHGLGKIPKMIIVKQRTGNVNNWPVYHTNTGNTKALYLDLNLSEGGNFTGAWNNTSPTSSVFSLGNSVETNRNSSPYIAYCWAEIEGFSKFGSYIGNGNADGPFVYLGFKPAWVLIKKTDGSGNENWRLFDSSRCPTNQNNKHLLPSTNSVESTETGMDFVSNGFKVRHTDAHQNQSGTTYIFAAFAESPFQTANAK